METLESRSHSGVIVPMATPLTPEGELDELAVRRVIDHLLGANVSGIFVLGTTGEALSLPRSLRSRLVALTVEYVGDRARTYAGIPDNCLVNSAEAGEEYFRMGIGTVVAHLPFYYQLDVDEQFSYFHELADRLPGALMLYNIPSTTHMSIPIEVVERLSLNPRVVGIKDSENDVGRLKRLTASLKGRPDFSVLIGAAVLSASVLSLGADGIVPSSGNLAPDLSQGIYESVLSGDQTGAEQYQERVNKVAAIYQRGRSLGQSLAALKAAMYAKGLCGATVMPPLCTLSPEQADDIRVEMSKLGILEAHSEPL